MTIRDINLLDAENIHSATDLQKWRDIVMKTPRTADIDQLTPPLMLDE